MRIFNPGNWVPRPLRMLTAAGAAVAVAGLLVLAAAPAAAAIADDDACRTVVAHLTDRPDNGHGTPPVWALDTVTRTVKVCHAEDAPAPAAAVEVKTWDYTATLVDEGTFVTKGSATGSPNAGIALTAGMHGTVHGAATFAKFTAPHHWGYWVEAFDGKSFTGSAPSGTGDWIKNLWSDGFSGTQITDYKWTYETCTETWVDSSEEGNGDGTADSAGDITGKACPTPSASPSVSTSPSGSTIVAVPADTSGSLPVTGSKEALIAGGGALAVAVGTVLVILFRRRRDETTFVAE